MRGGKLLERTLSVTPLYEEEMDAFTSFIVQYYEHNPLPNEILLPKEYDVSALIELYGNKIVQPQRGSKAKLVEMVLRNAKNAHEQKFYAGGAQGTGAGAGHGTAFTYLFQGDPPHRDLDNSHLAGTFNVSGMVVFMDGEPYKQGYRLYRLQEYRSDMDSMPRSALLRRYFRLLKEKGECLTCWSSTAGCSRWRLPVRSERCSIWT